MIRPIVICMRTVFIFSLFIFFFTEAVFSQSCLPEGITFNTQVQLDSFPLNFPNCTEIEGSVLISGSDIKNLSGLNGIIRIGEHLKFLNNYSLTSLSGLINLTEIGESLIIGSTDVPGGGTNPMLSTLSGLDNLEEVGQNLVVCRNDVLSNFEGLGSLRRIEERFYCLKNQSLLNFIGLTELDSIGNSIFVGGNPSLQDFSGLEGIIRINGSLVLGDCQVGYGGAYGGNGNATYVGLHNIEYVGGSLNICQSEQDHINGLEKISYVGGELKIDLNDNLLSLSGLDSLKYIGDGIEMGFNNDYVGAPCGNHNLTDITALMGLTSVGGGAIHIEDNPMLTSLSGLDNIDPESIGSLFVAKQNGYNYNGQLTWCSVKSICDYLDLYGAGAYFGENGPDPGCNSKSEVEENCEDSGIFDQDPILAVIVFPNPASGKVTVSIPEGVELYSIRIYSHLGIHIRRIDKHKEYVDISDLPQGMYIMEIITDSGRARRKLIVY